MSSKPPTLEDLSNLDDICLANDVESLGVFGSYSRGDFTPTSDVDLLVRFSKTKSLLDLVRIEREFSERLSRPVDLVTEASVSPFLRDRIFNEEKKLYEKSR
jgi:predicted nucleotidyltransferase